MKNKGLIATIIIMSGVIVMLLVTLLLIKMPSIVGIKDIVIDTYETESSTESEVIEIIDETIPLVPEVTANIVTYNGYNGNVSIEYPELSGIADLEQLNKLNHKIRTNALSIVPLYPISTALQKLDIYCEVKYLDENYITILYTGKVVGKNASTKNTTVNKSTNKKVTSSNNASAYDPYLNGFVDPLAKTGISLEAGIPVQTEIQNQYQNGNVLPNISNQIYDLLPSPKEDVTEVFKGYSDTTANNTNANKSAGSSTEDKGPVVKEIIAPTKSNENSGRGQVYYEGNIANNYPTSDPLNKTNDSSAGVVYSGNATVAPIVPDATVPNNPTGILTRAPVYAYTGSNTSASTIDQNIFYTNTIDLKNGIDISLDTFADVEELAKYARSSKVEFVNIDDSMASEVKTYIKKTVLSKLTEDLKEADFRNVGLKTWPKHFSYRDPDGTIYFTIKLSSKLGNYAIIKYAK